MVTTVGSGLLQSRLGQAQAALREAGIEWDGMIASDSSLMFALKGDACEQAQEVLHGLFLQGELATSETT